MARAGKRKTARISHRHSSRNSTKNSVEDEEETIHEEDDAESTKVADTESTKVADAADSETRPRVDGNSSPGSISLTESIRALGDMSFNSPDYAGEVYSGGKFVTDLFCVVTNTRPSKKASGVESVWLLQRMAVSSVATKVA